MKMTPENSSYAVTADGLSVKYTTQCVLQDVTLSIPASSITGIIGPNGAGKSTFIKSCLNLVKPCAGHVRLFGRPVKDALDLTAYVPQTSDVDWHFPVSVLDVTLMGMVRKIGLGRFIGSSHKKRALEILDQVKMADFKDRQIGQLSGGQKQRMIIARALASEAPLLFLDEPFAGVDAASEKIIHGLFKELQKEGKTLIMVHHDLRSALHYFDHILLLNVQKIAFGPSKEVLTQHNLNLTYHYPAALIDA